MPKVAHKAVKSEKKTNIDLKKILAPGSHMSDRFIPDYKQLKKVVGMLKQAGYRIVLTQGVYDLLHEGHALYLEAARAHGDILIVGVDSDELTKKRKGPNRPVVPQNERIKMLIHLRHTDIVTVRELHHDIGDLIRLVEPDVLITSASTKDFTKSQINEYSDYCGKIVVLPPQATTSTTARIRTLSIDGAEKLATEVGKLTTEFLEKIRKI
ncbi:adenylyltransferase/cytidyltransferase family protein [Candidatus Parcubacteria bacterium]|nr:adenylyltransferase/cytidyltransferase family protein [Candidatus Parcubacteria bacterium]